MKSSDSLNISCLPFFSSSFFRPFPQLEYVIVTHILRRRPLEEGDAVAAASLSTAFSDLRVSCSPSHTFPFSLFPLLYF